jgi:hypothetical protein
VVVVAGVVVVVASVAAGVVVVVIVLGLSCVGLCGCARRIGTIARVAIVNPAQLFRPFQSVSQSVT